MEEFFPSYRIRGARLNRDLFKNKDIEFRNAKNNYIFGYILNYMYL